jgi:serine/threonine protein phosphatase PrpC
VRETNEDVYLLRRALGLFVVCDGMGGGPDGEIASRLAAETIVQHVRDDGGRTTPCEGSGEFLPHTHRLAAAVRASNGIVYRHGREDPRRAGMGTTVVGAWVADHIASVAHVGDSRAYLWHDGRLHPLTRDHSLGETLADQGLAHAAALPADQENTLVRVLGGEPDVDVDLKEVPVQRGDYLLLCSDGLTRMVTESAMSRAIARLRDPQRICAHLIDAANANGGTDNITVVVIEVVGTWRHWVADLWTRRMTGATAPEARPEFQSARSGTDA